MVIGKLKNSKVALMRFVILDASLFTSPEITISKTGSVTAIESPSNSPAIRAHINIINVLLGEEFRFWIARCMFSLINSRLRLR